MNHTVLTIMLPSSDIRAAVKEIHKRHCVGVLRLVHLSDTTLADQPAVHIALSCTTHGVLAEFLSALSKHILLSTSLNTQLKN